MKVEHRSDSRATSTIVILLFRLQKCATFLPIQLLHNYIHNIKILKTIQKLVWNKISSYSSNKQKNRRDIHGVHILAVQLSLYRIFGLQQVDVPRISRQAANEGGKGVMPYAPAAFSPSKYSWYSSLLQDESTPGPQCGRRN